MVKGRISARNPFLNLNLDPCAWSENFQVIDKNHFISCLVTIRKPCLVEKLQALKNEIVVGADPFSTIE